MKKIIYQDEFFKLTENGEYLESEIKNYPESLFSFGKGFFHSNMKEFELFKNRFIGVYECLKNKIENSWFIVCRSSKYLDSISCEIDIRHKLTNDEAANAIIKSFEEKRDKAIKRINEIVAKGDNVNCREEQEIDDLAKEFNLEDRFREHMGSPKLQMRMVNLHSAADDLLIALKKHNKESL